MGWYIIIAIGFFLTWLPLWLETNCCKRKPFKHDGKIIIQDENPYTDRFTWKWKHIFILATSLIPIWGIILGISLIINFMLVFYDHNYQWHKSSELIQFLNTIKDFFNWEIKFKK
jgi:hypothetical protein